MIRESRSKQVNTEYAEVSYQVISMFRAAPQHDYVGKDQDIMELRSQLGLSK